jgi:hypothetical protein
VDESHGEGPPEHTRCSAFWRWPSSCACLDAGPLSVSEIVIFVVLVQRRVGQG